jgi:hypothetical protein
MPRAYTVATAALALNVSTKWIDNTLSHFSVQGVTQARQGVARKLSVESLMILSIALTLIHDLDVPVENAVDVGTQIIESHGRLRLPLGVALEIDLQDINAALLERLERAVEMAPLPRRGRPPQKTTGRLD